MDQRLRAMLPLFAALFIDLFSFGLMYPVIVALFRQPSIVAAYSPAILSVYLSLAFSLFPFGMFFGAALLGDLSDALGRRRTLLICMAGLGTSYLLMMLGVQTGVLEWLLLGRLTSGLMAGTSPIAQAAMMDMTPTEERGTSMSQVVLVNSLALVSGPALGGVLAHVDFRLPLLMAALLCVGAFTWIALSHTEDSRPRKKLSLSLGRPIEVFVRAWRHPVLWGLAAAFFLFQLGFSMYYIYVLLLLQRSFGATPTELGLFSATLGVGFIFGTLFGYKWAIRLLGSDARAVTLGLALCGAFIVIAGLPIGEGPQWALALLAAACNLPAYIGLLTLISQATTADEQGWALGIGAAMTALPFCISGLLAGVLGLIPIPILLIAGGLIVIAGIVPLRAVMRPVVTQPAG
jgi:DHA1 family tetracycline resistance protein-like MFS transporter